MMSSQNPYHLALPAEAPVEEGPLRLRLDFHEDQVILHEYAAEAVRVRRVSALDIAHALARELDLSTGLLPPQALWWTQTASGVRVAVWREPQVWTVRLREQPGERPRRFRLPMPGLVFVCLPDGAPYLFAALACPRSPDEPLFHCPTFNIFPSGRVCTGSQPFPSDPARVPETFFESFFSPHAGQGKSRKYPDDVGLLWAELDRQPAFPLDDLVPHLSVGEAMRLGR